jgi:two-component system, chemotaxis family, chemotaxis protein CheY
MMRQLILFALGRIPGVECTEAEDGVDALRKLKKGGFDAVLLDINMPVMDGLKLLELVRKDPAHAKIPIVMITTEGRPEDVARALELGANDYLTKPVQAQQVVDTVSALLG